jgi:putative adenylate-forming enzyme
MQLLFKLQIVLHWLRFRCWPGDPASRAQLEARQRRALRKLLRWLRRRSPWYREALAAAGGDWRRLPVMQKRSFMAEFSRINTAGIGLDEAYALALEAERSRNFSPTLRGITVGLSTGTSGNRGIFLVSPSERARWAAMMFHRVAPPRSLRKRRLAFFLRANSNLYSSVRSALLEFAFFDLLEPAEHNLSRLQAFQPDLLIAQPSMLRIIAEAQLRGTVAIRPERVISVAEVLEPRDRALCARAFGQEIHQVYQCTEGFLACTCRLGTLHWNEDLILLEKRYADSSRTRYFPIITDLTRRTQPVVRYELDDLILPPEAPCPCGSPFEAIGAIEGRLDDVFLLRDQAGALQTVFPDFIRRALIQADPAVEDYQAVQTGPDAVTVHLNGPEPLLEPMIGNLGALFQRMNLTPVQIRPGGPLPPQEGRKLRRVSRIWTPQAD